MNKEGLPPEGEETPFGRFRQLAREVFNTPLDEVKRRQEEWEAGREKRKRRKKNGTNEVTPPEQCT